MSCLEKKKKKTQEYDPNLTQMNEFDSKLNQDQGLEIPSIYNVIRPKVIKGQ